MDTKKLRQKILDLAIRGKLVLQDPNDEPASVLIEKIRAKKKRLIEENKIKQDKNESYIYRSDKSYYEKFADGTVKCIDVEIPFEIPESWEWARLGSIARAILYGVSESAQTEGNYKLLRITDIQNNTVNWENVPFTTLPEDKAIEYLLRKDDILFARTGATVGKSYLVNEISNDAIYASYLIRVRLFELFESQYIKFYFESGFYWNQITDKSVGVGQPNVNGTSLKSLLIPVPPYKEQIQIGEQALMLTSIIDNIDNNKNLLADSIKNVKSKILDLAIRGKLVLQDPSDEPASALLERIKKEYPENPKKASKTSDNSHYAFVIPDSWKWVIYGDYIDVRDGTHDSPKYVVNGFPFITSKNLVDGEIDFSNAKYISEKDHMNFIQRSFVEDGDILFAMIGSIGNPVLVKKDREFSIKNVALFKPYSRDYTDMKYVYFFLLHMQEPLKARAKGGMQPFIPLNLFRQHLHIPIPPANEQKRIVKKIEEIFHTLDAIEISIRA